MSELRFNSDTAERLLTPQRMDMLIGRTQAYAARDDARILAIQARQKMMTHPYGHIIVQHAPFFGYYDKVTGYDAERSEPVCTVFTLGAGFMIDAFDPEMQNRLNTFAVKYYGTRLDAGHTTDFSNFTLCEMVDSVFEQSAEIRQQAGIGLAALLDTVRLEDLSDLENRVVPGNIDAQRVFRLGAGLVIHDLAVGDDYLINDAMSAMLGAADESTFDWDSAFTEHFGED